MNLVVTNPTVTVTPSECGGTVNLIVTKPTVMVTPSERGGAVTIVVSKQTVAVTAIPTTVRLTVVPVATSRVITAGVQGLQGIQGPPGPAGATTLTSTAGANLSGDRIVTYDGEGKVVYASSDASSALTVLGVTLHAALADDEVSVQTYGQVTEPSWSWIPLEPVYLSTNGTITQAAPTSGYCVRLGFAADAHTIMLAIEPALKLA